MGNDNNKILNINGLVLGFVSSYNKAKTYAIRTVAFLLSFFSTLCFIWT